MAWINCDAVVGLVWLMRLLARLNRRDNRLPRKNEVFEGGLETRFDAGNADERGSHADCFGDDEGKPKRCHDRIIARIPALTYVWKYGKVERMGKQKETVLVLRTCGPNMESYRGFIWPKTGHVEAPDWSPEPTCGRGLHGLLWGEGDGSMLNWNADANWMVLRVETDCLVDLGRKVKFPACEIEFCGERMAAVAYISANGAAGRAVVSGTATAGLGGTATAGDRGTATAGAGGVIVIQHWNGKRYKMKIAHVKDEDGDGQLEPNVPYRLDDAGNFVVAKK